MTYRVVDVDTLRPVCPEPLDGRFAVALLYEHIWRAWPEADFRIVDEAGRPVPVSRLRRAAA